MSGRFLLTSLIGVLLTGCAYPGTYDLPRERKASAPVAPKTQPVPYSPGSPEALAYNTSAYAQTIEEQMKRRAAKPAPTDAGSFSLESTPKTSALPLPRVDWLEPKESHLTLGPPQSSEGPDKTTPTEPTVPNRPTTATDAEPRAVPPSLREEAISSDELAQKLMRQLKGNAKNLSAQVDWQLLQLLVGRPVPQMDWVGALPAEDREIVSALMDALGNFRTNIRADDNAMFSKKVRPFIEMAERLRAQADLRIPTVAMCSRVDGYGVYEPVDPTRFQVGRDHKVILYFEVENFMSRMTAARQWETSLTESAILYNERGQRVWEDGRQPIADISRNRRHDFFARRMIQLPATLPAGKYSLKVSVIDQLANRFAEERLAVEVLER